MYAELINAELNSIKPVDIIMQITNEILLIIPGFMSNSKYGINIAAINNMISVNMFIILLWTKRARPIHSYPVCPAMK